MKKILIIIMLCEVTSSYAQVPPPPFAASTETWVIELDDGTTQIWSDYINLPTCNKEAYKKNKADCRRGEEGILYSYNAKYIKKHKDILCPAPWRVPSERDLHAYYDCRLHGRHETDFCQMYPFLFIPYRKYNGYRMTALDGITLILFFQPLNEADAARFLNPWVPQKTAFDLVRCIQTGH
jgi:hypothetical protein